MARIRTIKPEFCQSEKVGRLSRDARLLFIQLWTFVDDLGRCRGNSRLLAASLYPYDEDALDLIDAWIGELEKEDCVRRYVIDGTTFLDIPNWGKHQRIDNAGKSRIPEFGGEPPRTAVKIGEPPLYLGPRTDDDVEDTRGHSLISSEAYSLADEVAKIVGHDPEFVPPAWHGAPYRAQVWLNGGWPKELILLSVREQTARKRDGPPSKIDYFEKGIASAIARQNAPLPQVVTLKPEIVNAQATQRKTGGSLLAAIDRLEEKLTAAGGDNAGTAAAILSISQG